MRTTSRAPVEEKGSAFFIVTALAVVAVVLVGAFLTGSLGKARHVNLQISEGHAFNAAESGLNAMVAQLWGVYSGANPRTRVADLDSLDGKFDPLDRLELRDRPLGGSTYSAWVRNVNVVGSAHADVEIVARGEHDGAVKVISAVVRYGQKPARVFDHAYFINNFGWLWGAGITVNGSVSSNADFSVKSATVNGDIFASENAEFGATGIIEGELFNDSLVDYNANQPDRARPSNPTAPTEDANGNGVLDAGEDVNGNGVLDTYDLVDGYDGTVERVPHQRKVEMPYIGDLSTYRDLAAEKKGTISQGGTILVDGVLGDDLSEDKNLVLVGTVDNPIVISGPVVVENDVVLKGVITGQGTIYAGRNVHILGDLTYADPPSWAKPIQDIEGLKAANATRDLVGLAAKGSVIIGDYTGAEFLDATKPYQTPPFVKPYQVDPSDAGIGYVTGYDADGNPVFDGNYRGFDGGLKSDGSGGTVSRKFYESSLADSVIAAMADPEVRQVDAVIYTNHLLSGKVGAAEFNGVLVSRDEAIIYGGSLTINYDIRVRHGSYEFLDVYLPTEPDHRVLFWREGVGTP